MKLNDAPLRLLMGPQRPQVNLGEAFAAAGFAEGPLAVISAGMQEAEGDLEHVRTALNRPLVDLALYQRAEQLEAEDAGLRAAYRERQDRLLELQGLYRRRLRPLARAVREMHQVDGAPQLLAPEQRHAVAQLRALDQHHLARVEDIHAAFEAACSLETHPALAEQVKLIATALSGCAALLITGGNVIVLMNRMRLFGMGRFLRDRPILAWSAGAMVLAERVVLYHDRLPQGRRDPEVIGAGFGVLPGFVFLPDAQHRLRDRDELRTRLFGRRFAPDACITLDNGSALRFEGVRLVSSEGARRISRSGRLARVRA